MPVASRLRGKSAVLKIWHRGAYDRRKLTDLIALWTELGNRVDRHLGIALPYLGRIVPAVTVPKRDQVLFARIVIYAESNR
jgi:hypothetical protein